MTLLQEVFNLRIITDDLKNFASKINLAIEKSKINPKAGWVELIVVDGNLKLQVANFDYSLEAKIPCEFISGTDFDVTVYHHSGDCTQSYRKWMYEKFGDEYARDYLFNA